MLRVLLLLAIAVALLPFRAPTTVASASGSPAPAPVHVPILMYHRLAEIDGDTDPLTLRHTVSPDSFLAQVAYLAQSGYHPITLDQLAGHLTTGSPLPEKPVVLTFDDGWACAHGVALPALRKHGFTGVFFAYPSAITEAGGRFLSWSQLDELAAAGMSIQSHTMSHPHLPALPADEAMRELSESKNLLQRRLGRPVTALAYPYGEHDTATVALAREAGYTLAVTTEPGATHAPADLLTLRRVIVTYTDSLDDFAAKLRAD